MSLLIEGMKMPENCCECLVNMSRCHYGYKYLSQHPELYDKRSDNCPITEVPSHGRLIDADALQKVLYQLNWDRKITDMALFYMNQIIEKIPVIIEAEEGE